MKGIFMFTFKSNVRYSETDENGNLSLTALMNYLQDCCLLHSESRGVGPANMASRHRAWLLSSWQIVIDRYPRMFEEITVGTKPYDFSGGLGCRNFVVMDAQGEYMVRANSVWLYLNTETGRPMRPEATELEVYALEERISMDYLPRRIALPKEMTDAEPIPVRRHHLDTNHHVNNAQYVEIARELFDENLAVKQLRVEYRKQALLGDVMYPHMGAQDDWRYVSLTDEAGHLYASVALQVGSAQASKSTQILSA